jgi:microcystin-dependent protein
MSTPFLGQIEIFSFNFAPKGWALCNGQLLPINQNQALFSLLGTTYGGDGRVNFALPDLRSRVPIGFGGNVALGERAGEEAHTVILSEMAQHNHALNGDSTTAASSNTFTPGASGSSVLGNQGGTITPSGTFNVQAFSTMPPNNALNPAAIVNSGGSQPHENRMPCLVLSMCIALQGIFPSQN